MEAREAVEKSEKMWTLMAHEGVDKKVALKALGETTNPSKDCYLCQYTKDIGSSCSGCPLYGTWSSKGRCIDAGSPYLALETEDGYVDFSTPQARADSWRVVALHREWLEANPAKVDSPAQIGDTYMWLGSVYSIRRAGADGMILVGLEGKYYYSGLDNPFGQKVLTADQMQQEINYLVDNFMLVYMGKIQDIITINKGGK